MNIAAEELGRDIAFWEASEPSESARVWCTLLLKEEKELYFFLSFFFVFVFCFSFFFFLFLFVVVAPSTTIPTILLGGGSENTQLVWPD